MRPQYADALSSCRCVGVALHDVGRQLYTQSKHVVAAHNSHLYVAERRDQLGVTGTLWVASKDGRVGEDIKDVVGGVGDG